MDCWVLLVEEKPDWWGLIKKKKPDKKASVSVSNFIITFISFGWIRFRSPKNYKVFNYV